MKTDYELRYSGTFGDSLYGVYATRKEALAAQHEAVACAVRNGDRRLADTFYLK